MLTAFKQAHNMLNHLKQPPLFLSAGGGCSRETEEMVHAREQKTSGVEWKLLNRPPSGLSSISISAGCYKYLLGIRDPLSRHTRMSNFPFTVSQERNEGAVS